jgi:hypothetical protein
MPVTSGPYWENLVFHIVVFSNPRVDDGIVSDMPYFSFKTRHSATLAMHQII